LDNAPNASHEQVLGTSKGVTEQGCPHVHIPKTLLDHLPNPTNSQATEEEEQFMMNTPNETKIVRLVKKGGTNLMSLLLNQAIKPSSSEFLIPVHYKNIAQLPVQQQKAWNNACHDELEALCKRQVYDLVKLPPNCKVIGNRWVFAEKSDLWKHARLVAKGFSQIEDIDYEEIFSPIIHYETVCLMFSLVALEGMYMTGLDVKTTFLYRKLKEEIYMKQPEGFIMKGHEDKVMHLKHALYGLKQAYLAWWCELEAFMKTQGFH